MPIIVETKLCVYAVGKGLYLNLCLQKCGGYDIYPPPSLYTDSTHDISVIFPSIPTIFKRMVSNGQFAVDTYEISQLYQNTASLGKDMEETFNWE